MAIIPRHQAVGGVAAASVFLCCGRHCTLTFPVQHLQASNPYQLPQANPYQSPQANALDDPRARSYHRAGTLIIWTICIIYVPMVIGPIVAIFQNAKEPAWFLILASAFNGMILLLVIQVGRFLRRRGKRLQAMADAKIAALDESAP
jgi:hypothetical protein